MTTTCSYIFLEKKGVFISAKPITCDRFAASYYTVLTLRCTIVRSSKLYSKAKLQRVMICDGTIKLLRKQWGTATVICAEIIAANCPNLYCQSGTELGGLFSSIRAHWTSLSSFGAQSTNSIAGNLLYYHTLVSLVANSRSWIIQGSDRRLSISISKGCLNWYLG